MRTFAVAACCALLSFAVCGPQRSALAEDMPGVSTGASPDRDQLKSKWTQLKDQMKNLRGKIAEYSKQVGNLSDPKTTEAEVAALQADVSEALSETLDNGTIATLAQKILDTDKSWLADIYKHGWSPDRIALLEGRFKATIEKTQHTIDDISRVRRELVSTLKRIQNDSDYLEALARAEESEEMARVLQSLLQDLRATSDNLKAIVDDVPGV
jgi:DNA repair ATPase RecN